MPGFTAVNHRKQSAEASSSRVLPVQTSGAQEEEADEAESSQAARRREEDLPTQIPDRDWEIIRIVDRKDANGLLMYRVQWAYTKHPTAILQSRRSGEAITVNGKVCKVLHRSTTQPDLETGAHTSLIEWREQWLPLWQLCSAHELVAEYELKHPRGKNRLQPPFKLHREPWKFEPEEEEDIDKRGDIEDDVFEPELGIDYTMSFLERQRADLDSEDGLKVAKSLMWLNMPVRQRLVFNDWFCARETEEARSYDSSRPGKHRAMFIYMVGDAWKTGCSHCESFDESLPFAKCVTLDGALMGACTNCTYMGRGRECSMHHDVRLEHTIRCVDAYASSNSTSTSPVESPANDSAVDLSSDSTLPSSPVRPGWVSPSPTPPGSPELGSEDFRGVHVQDQQMDDESSSPSIPRRRSKGKSARRKRSKEGSPSAGQEPTKVKKNRTRKGKKFVKPERMSSSDPPASLHLDTCRGAPYPCTHPIAGCEPPVIGDDSTYPPQVVFNDKKFTRGQATDEEIRYILSRCWCPTTECLQNMWEADQAEAAIDGDSMYDSKEDFLSIACYELLTDIARMCCPVPSWDSSKKIVIDLT
ncbi:hypothetical protein PRZ48_008735 [Zasmidium cellare]|uniref:BAH domain-containing protein n=1 Tax=Zasmidium cellare TaxID=395010 RepID=A0ABR0EH23_ZASCE|nr:hypothetical protein PRZ48_008735 [Zasmidium cellare]